MSSRKIYFVDGVWYEEESGNVCTPYVDDCVVISLSDATWEKHLPLGIKVYSRSDRYAHLSIDWDVVEGRQNAEAS